MEEYSKIINSLFKLCKKEGFYLIGDIDGNLIIILEKECAYQGFDNVLKNFKESLIKNNIYQ